jgi:ethanolamine ammonia-lyase small subunit
LGRAGHALPTAELLRFQLDHARARDAVYHELDPAALGLPHLLLRTAAADRRTYITRPDLGRTLSPESRARIERGSYDAAIVVVDGLSPTAVQRHAAPLLRELAPRFAQEGWRMAPLTVVLQGRVAIGDEIGSALGAQQVVVLIGERPGLTSPDSLGAYLTWEPRAGRTDAERNCLSNIRTEGIAYAAAAERLHLLMRQAGLRQLTGIALKEDELLLNSPTGIPE